jgi:hypothetical protein
MEPLIMKTDDLISLLASDPLPPQRRPWWKNALALLASTVIATAAVVATGVHHDLLAWLMLPSIALKTFWLLITALATAWAVRRLSRPGQSAGAALWVWPLAWLVMALLAVLESWGQAQSMSLWMGQSWNVCSFNILALSVPFLAALLWTLRDMASTQPALTGGVAGLLAGCLAASVYSLHCTETGLGFFTLWYGGGIALSGALGALIGGRWLRW